MVLRVVMKFHIRIFKEKMSRIILAKWILPFPAFVDLIHVSLFVQNRFISRFIGMNNSRSERLNTVQSQL